MLFRSPIPHPLTKFFRREAKDPVYRTRANQPDITDIKISMVLEATTVFPLQAEAGVLLLGRAMDSIVANHETYAPHVIMAKISQTYHEYRKQKLRETTPATTSTRVTAPPAANWSDRPAPAEALVDYSIPRYCTQPGQHGKHSHKLARPAAYQRRNKGPPSRCDPRPDLF